MAEHDTTASDRAETSIGAAAGEVGRAVGAKAEQLTERTTKAGAEAVSTLGRTAETVATSLQDEVPSVAAYVRSAGKRIDRLADDLKDKKAGELLAMATDFGRRRPLTLLAGSVLVGFALARVVKAGVETPSTSVAGPRANERDAGDISV